MRSNYRMLTNEDIMTRGKEIPDSNICVYCCTRPDYRIGTDDTAHIIVCIQIIPGGKAKDRWIKNP